MSRRRKFNDREKWCNKCSKWLPLDAFGDNKRTASGKQDYCKTCHGTYNNTFWQKVAAVDAALLEKFDMKAGDYLELWKSQDKQCLICEDALVLYYRETKVRLLAGKKILICAECDKGLTAFRADPVILRRAAELSST